ncbi:unnamed protein product [Gongylonema pulchrum]|uniref:HMG box domain-containing protein n=1 Tax=Gongylonema pulchrum TaxID=637853 RepID=A0A183DV67_9BILA|nr:unnamed protein product [Gongylonema pulchrum]
MAWRRERQALKENPHLVYHPQRKKLSKILMKADQSNLAFDTAPSTPASNGRATPITFASPNPTKLTLTGAAPGTVILTPAVNLRTPAQNTSQTQEEPTYHGKQINSCRADNRIGKAFHFYGPFSSSVFVELPHSLFVSQKLLPEECCAFHEVGLEKNDSSACFLSSSFWKP